MILVNIKLNYSKKQQHQLQQLNLQQTFNTRLIDLFINESFCIKSILVNFKIAQKSKPKWFIKKHEKLQNRAKYNDIKKANINDLNNIILIQQLIKRNTKMSYQPQQIQMARLRQILFPRRIKSSRLSLNASIDDVKQNIQNNHTSTIKQQISKLKQQIQAFLYKQSISCNFIATPRQCFQLIKCMGNNMINYGQQIQEAVKTLIESIPLPLTGTLPSSKYYLTQLKLNYLNSIFSQLKRKIIGYCFQQVKKISSQQQTLIKKQQQLIKIQHQKFYNYIYNKLSFAFNRWRINTNIQHKNEIQNNTYNKIVINNIKTIKLIAQQGKMVLWLQKLIQSNANLVQILLYNQKTSTLRSYKFQSQSLSSVFQSVQNPSRISNLDQSFNLISTKIKRLQINLQHSLTKICLIKKQILTIQQLKKDPDYSKIDQYTSLYGLSSRQLSGGCILTPIVYQNKTIGIIRQYFYDRLGESPKPETVSMIAQTLENNIKTSLIFEQIRQKSLAIRNKYYLKAILLLNFLEKVDMFSLSTQQQFQQLLLNYFHIKSLGEYSYQTTSTLDKFPSFTVTPVKGSQTSISYVVTALSKMSQSKSPYIYESSILYIKLPKKIFQFQVQKQQNNELNPIPIQILKQILQKKQLIKQKKHQQYQHFLQKKIISQNQIIYQQIYNTKNKILQFMLSVTNVESASNIIQVLQQYLSRFVYQSIASNTKPQIVLINKTHNKATSITSSSLTLYQDQTLLITIANFQHGQPSQIQQHILTPLIDLTNFLIIKLKKPSIVNSSIKKLDDLTQICYQMGNYQKSMTSLLTTWLQLPVQQVKVLTITKDENPFISQSYYCWLQKKYSDISSPQLFLKSLKTSSTLQPTGLNPLFTILCLQNKLLILITRHLDINQPIITKLSKILQYWIQQYQSLTYQQKKIKNYTRIIQAIHRCENLVVVKKIKLYFYLIKNAKIKYRYIPNIMLNYIKQENCKCLHYALNSIKNYLPRKQKTPLSKISHHLSNLSQIIIKRSQTFFQIYKQNKQINQKLIKITRILISKINNNLQLTFHQLYMKKYVNNINHLSIIQQVFTKHLFSAFQLLKRYTKTKSILETTLTQTQCSIITKLDNLTQISNIIKTKFYNFSAYLYLKNGYYLSLSTQTIKVNKQLQHDQGFQHYQFTSQTKTPIKYVVWLIPQTYTISLIEKHYLQVLSKAIQQGFMKFIYKNQQFLYTISHFSQKKSTQYLKYSLNLLRQLTMQSIKTQQYAWRNCYYQSNIQVQNYKLIQKQQKREQQQQVNQLRQIYEQKKNSQQNLSNNRKTLIRLDISSRHLEQIQYKSRIELTKKNIHRVFNIWRIKSAQQKQCINLVKLSRKKQIHAIICILTAVNKSILSNLNLAFRMLLFQSAQTKARIHGIRKNRALEQIHKNRLITFQDQPNEFTLDYHKDNSPLKNNKLNKQRNIIPISFKYFSTSQNQNYDVTAEQAKKFNGGAYKLNAKTLKFLKRMGKLNNN